MPGKAISQYEITSITRLGFWFLVDDLEYFVPFVDYPAFTHATVAQIHDVQRPGARQFYWAQLDVDIDLDALEHPERYPLTFAGVD